MIILIEAIRSFAWVLTTLLIVRAILSWFVNPYQSNRNSAIYKINSIVIQITEPLVIPFRKFLSRFNTGMFDFSVIFAFFAINMISNIIIRLLVMLAL